ncbi:T9SS type A sorting domain-containing protein [Eisenibacter elegans]|uniref:T9SS type A sorting domain-containing protein n=1 Tax=Eisenibacter elegans TaxID=997 RepID=UPI0012B57232|nr:T9SS type A sorting domain-containing protein [Eisenibacter elegans]
MKKLLLVVVILFSHQIQAQTINVNNVSGSPFCAGDVISVNFIIGGTFNSGNTFFAELSDASGSFSSPTVIGSRIGTTAGTIFATLPPATPAGTGYRVRIRANDPVVLSTNVTTAFIVGNFTSDPNTFGNGRWLAHTYRANDFTQYVGAFQTGTALSFNSEDYYPRNSRPSEATGYVGCQTQNNNHSVDYRRTNFPCDYYQINIPTHEDHCELIINGTTVFSQTGAGGPHNNVWRGFLGPSSQVSFRVRKVNNNESRASLTLIPAPNPLVLTNAVIKCAAATVAMTVSAPMPLNYTWSPAVGLSSTTGATVSTNVTTNTTYTVTGTDPVTGCQVSRTVEVIIDDPSPLNVSIAATDLNICPGQSVTLTASGAATYTWSGAGLSSSAGVSVIATPTTTTTYTLTGSDGCSNTATTTITINVGAPPSVDPNVYGINTWNVYAYAYTAPLNFATATLLGSYVHNGLSFDSNDRWGQTASPSAATGYVGCPVPNDFHVVSYRREGFPCDFYQINIPHHDDQYWLYIDGNLVASGNCCGGSNNAWRGILNENSRVEFRWREEAGNSRGGVTFVPINPILTPPSTVCLGDAINLLAQNDPTATYEWRDASNNIIGTNPTVSVSPTATTTYTLRVTKGTCVVTNTVLITVDNSSPVVIITPASPQICGGQSVTLTATGANTYIWRDASNNIIGTNNTITVSPALTTTYSVVGSIGCASGTATTTVTVGGMGDPNEFGNNVWNVYAYDGRAFNRYFGMYVEPVLSFNSLNRWPNNGSPSQASGYVGCVVPNDLHSVRYKRRGFPCGYYQIDVVRHDDECWLIIDGVTVYSRATWNPNEVSNVWRGFLGPNSEVEFRWGEGSGGSNGTLRFTDLATTLGFTSPDVTICEGSSTNLSANIPTVSGVTFEWITDPAFIELSSTTGNNVTATARPGANGVRTVTCRLVDLTTGCTVDRNTTITVDPLANTTLSAPVSQVCIGESVTFVATGANTYSWSASTAPGVANLSATTGNSITVSPTETTTYYVDGSNNCNVKRDSVTITVLKPTIPATTFGDGEWNVFVYDGNIITNPALPLKGHYTEKSISFDSRNRWNANGTPSSATARPDGSQGYVGCPVGVDNHSVIYKRTNFPCGVYTISVSNHDDAYRLLVNGILVSSNNGCCTSQPNVWSGLLDEHATIEFIWQETAGGSHGGLSIGFSLASATTAIWTGAQNTDWFNPLNWCPSAPTATTRVIIPGAGVPQMPVIAANGAVCEGLQIDAGASLMIQPGFELGVYGDWQNNGTSSLTGATVRFLGTANANLAGAGTQNFHRLVVDKTGGRRLRLERPVSVAEQLVLRNGELMLNNQTLTIQNPATTAITRENNAFIRSETNAAINPSIVCWNTGTNTGNYVYPFGTAENAAGYIPLTIQKTAITTNTQFCVATRATGVDNVPFAQSTHMNSIVGGGPLFTVDRWWNITSSVNPLPAPGVDIRFTYRAAENTLPDPVQALAVQKFDFSFADWLSPFSGGGTGVSSGIGTVDAQGVQAFSPFVITLASQPLPVTLLNFEVQALPERQAVQVDWTTAHEQNNAHFVVERSADGRTFASIAQVPANTQDLRLRRYQYVDQAPLPGTSYYRLRQVDISGEAQIYRTVAVQFQQMYGLQVLPNPSDGYALGLRLQEESSVGVQISIRAMDGQTIRRLNVRTDSAGRWQETLVFPQKLPAGAYLVEAVSEGHSFVEKLIVR